MTPIIDRRGELPAVEGREPYARRELSEIYGVVVHHTGGRHGLQAVARYHVEHNDAPGIQYHLWIDVDGSVSLCNDMQAITWSQGGAGSPVPYTQPNRNFVSVVLRGDLTKREPHPAQAVALRWLWVRLRERFGLHGDMLFSHMEFKHTECPGSAGPLVDEMADDPAWHRMPWSVREAQEMLSRVLPTGEQILLDGINGPKTRAAAGGDVETFPVAYALAARWLAS